jgi:hypothetical protein
MHMTHILQVGIPDALGFVVRMADIVADMRRFAAEFTYPAHEYTILSSKGREEALLIINQNS